MVVAQTARGPVESQHTRGLTIQLSQGQGRQPLRPEGRFRPRVCCAHKLLLPAMVVRRWQDKTPERCVSTEKKWSCFAAGFLSPLLRWRLPSALRSI